MLQMPTVESIRDLWAVGKSQRETARILNVSRGTVAKYLDKDDFNEKLPVKTKSWSSKDDPVKGKIRVLTDKEEGRFRKQKFTADRMHSYLVNECGYSELAHSYQSIRRYMKEYRALKARERDYAPGTMPLVWHPGEAQADFGGADFEMAGGKRERQKYLVLSFPYSNRIIRAVLPGENCECVCQGLRYFLTI